MSGYSYNTSNPYHGQNWRGEEVIGDDNDDTYLEMNQFQERSPVPSPGHHNFSSNIGSILMRNQNDNTALAPSQTNYRKSGEFDDWRTPITSPHGPRHSVDFSHTPSPQVGRKPRASVPNYTPVTLKNKALPGRPGNPPIPGPRPSRLPGDGPAVDDQEAYLTFEEPPSAPGGYHHHQPPPPRRQVPPPLFPPHSGDAGPPIPNRSPTNQVVRSPYDDHKLPGDRFSDNKFPDRPPPPPPGQSPTSPPQSSLSKYPPMPRRTGSDKSDPGNSSPGPTRESSLNKNSHAMMPGFTSEILFHAKTRQGNISTESRDSGHGSPGSSREPSWKDSGTRLPIAHLPSRANNSSTESRESGHDSPVASRGPSWKNHGFSMAHVPSRPHNASTGSNSSSGSDEMTKPVKPPPVTKNNFADMKKDKHFSKFPPSSGIPRGRPITPMPPMPMTTPDPVKTEELVEDQLWYQDVDRHAAAEQIEKYKEEGMFIIRPKNSSDQPYALTVWASGKTYNFIIRKKPRGDFALGTEKPNEPSSDNIMDLVKYYQNNRIVLQNNNDTVKLTRPPPPPN